jgi:16S rRNA (uracil1498-N3)-methyltransferase
MAERFYVNWPLAPGLVVLEGQEAHHLATVCRARAGDAVCLFNGDGQEYPATVITADRRRVTLQVAEADAPARELGFVLEVAAPLPKGDRAQFLLEKLTELGATRFVPLRTDRSVVHPGATRLEKLQRYVIEASKQCGRNVLLDVQPLMAWTAYCGRSDLPGLRVVAHLEGRRAKSGGRPVETTDGEGSTERTSELSALCPPPSALGGGVALAVGPEGGFTEDEIRQARAAGWRTVNLGPRTLRIETAALVLTTWATMFPSATS